MKFKIENSKLKIAGAILGFLGALAVCGEDYKLNFTPSPDETNGAVLGYVGVWTPTNSFATNSTATNWNVFARVAVGSTNITITALVPSPAYLAVETQGTNYLLSAPTNRVLYDKAALALIYTNNPAPPRAPSVPTLSQ